MEGSQDEGGWVEPRGADKQVQCWGLEQLGWEKRQEATGKAMPRV